ncbi:hypothetical protein F4561_005438 [Lipingzhangella halophila]|uniref:DUF7660 domain-containing protein n=1 Tax=Lipingzhangella halophila TaxID=1783352 RepID=A0A7W7W5D9_9ACTN|nr:hypothetical protein [Lipingzhangella halophila]MBB4934618.1 hypothetical protein [Lipingzhangella halophila]
MNHPSFPTSGGPDVGSRQELAAFVLLLSQEYSQRGDQWENVTLDRYLEALSAWIDSADSWYANTGHHLPQDGDWTFFARALAAAAIYE